MPALVHRRHRTPGWHGARGTALPQPAEDDRPRADARTPGRWPPVTWPCSSIGTPTVSRFGRVELRAAGGRGLPERRWGAQAVGRRGPCPRCGPGRGLWRRGCW